MMFPSQASSSLTTIHQENTIKRSHSNSSKNRHGRKSLTFCLAGLSVIILLSSVVTQFFTSHASLDLHLAQLSLIDAAHSSGWSSGFASSSTDGGMARSAPFETGPARAIPALPVQSDTQDFDKKRKKSLGNTYGGGQGDPKHLGGFQEFGVDTISPAVWKIMAGSYNIKSVLDIGCGRGWSTLWFLLHNVDATCVEASKHAIRDTVIPQEAIKDGKLVEHDFTLGPWWPTETVDAIWAADFVQQVSLNYQGNYLTAFRKAALIFMTVPQNPGWHHVEVHSHNWWIRRLTSHGLQYDDQLTRELRKVASEEVMSHAQSPDRSEYLPISIASHLLVFINPVVAGLEAHDHLFNEFGCVQAKASDGSTIHRECATDKGALLETKLNPRLYPTQLTLTMDEAWDNAVRAVVSAKTQPHTITQSNDSSTTFPPAHDPAIPTGYFTGEMANHAVARVKAQVAKGNTTILPKIPIVVYPYFEFGIKTAENQHIEENGINESKYLELSTDVYNFDPNVVWVGDTGYPYQWNAWCARFMKHISAAQEKRIKRGLSRSWPIYIVDFSDSSTRQRCPTIEKAVGTDYVHYSKRSRVIGRAWDPKRGWVNSGKMVALMDKGKYYMHTPLVVRTDTIENLKHEVEAQGWKLSGPIEKMERKVDVTHLWPVAENDKHVGTIHSNLRHTVSKYLDYLKKTTKLNIFVGLAGSAVREGRRGVKSEYVDAMLSTKILVITQRDKWEDHYRLFEGLVSGAMVMTDHMFQKPKDIVNGTSIVDFTSLDDLRAKIFYYLEHPEERLAIARRGRFAAMMRHRTWHRIEEIIFGDILTNCTKSPDCPFIVHANEGSR